MYNQETMTNAYVSHNMSLCIQSVGKEHERKISQVYSPGQTLGPQKQEPISADNLASPGTVASIPFPWEEANRSTEKGGFSTQGKQVDSFHSPLMSPFSHFWLFSQQINYIYQMFFYNMCLCVYVILQENRTFFYLWLYTIK